MKYRLKEINSFKEAQIYGNPHWCLTEKVESWDFYRSHSRIFVLEIENPAVKSEKIILMAPDIKPPQIRDLKDCMPEQFSDPTQKIVLKIMNNLK